MRETDKTCFLSWSLHSSQWGRKREREREGGREKGKVGERERKRRRERERERGRKETNEIISSTQNTMKKMKSGNMMESDW